MVFVREEILLQMDDDWGYPHDSGNPCFNQVSINKNPSQTIVPKKRSRQLGFSYCRAADILGNLGKTISGDLRPLGRVPPTLTSPGSKAERGMAKVGGSDSRPASRVLGS